jgi:hypothetical protein
VLTVELQESAIFKFNCFLGEFLSIDCYSHFLYPLIRFVSNISKRGVLREASLGARKKRKTERQDRLVFITLDLQQNLWVNFGSGKSHMVSNSAV